MAPPRGIIGGSSSSADVRLGTLVPWVAAIRRFSLSGLHTLTSLTKLRVTQLLPCLHLGLCEAQDILCSFPEALWAPLAHWWVSQHDFPYKIPKSGMI